MQFIVDIPAAKTQRLYVAFGAFFGLTDDTTRAPRHATQAEVEAFLLNELKKIVLIQERRTAEAALQQPDF